MLRVLYALVLQLGCVGQPVSVEPEWLAARFAPARPAFDPSGKRVAVCDAYGGVAIVNVTSGQIVHRLHDTNAFWILDWRQDGVLVALTRSGRAGDRSRSVTLALINPATGEIVREYDAAAVVAGRCRTTSRGYVLVASASSLLRTYTSLRIVAVDSRHSPRALLVTGLALADMAPTGQLVLLRTNAIQGYQQLLEYRSLEGRILGKRAVPGVFATAMDVSPDGGLLAYAGGKDLFLVRMPDGEAMGQRQEALIRWLEFGPNSRVLAVACSDLRVRVLQVPSLSPLRLSKDRINGSAFGFDPRGERIAVVGDGQLTVVDLRTLTTFCSVGVGVGSPMAIGMTSHNQLLVLEEQFLMQWTVPEATHVRREDLPGDHAVQGIVATHGHRGAYVAYADERNTLWLRMPAAKWARIALPDDALALGHSPDEGVVYVLTSGGHLYSVVPGEEPKAQEVQRLGGTLVAAFSPRGSFLALVHSATPRTIRVIRLKDGRIAESTALSIRWKKPDLVAVADTGSVVVVGWRNSPYVWVYTLARREVRGTILRGSDHYSGVDSVVVDRAGQHVIVLQRDGTKPVVYCLDSRGRVSRCWELVPPAQCPSHRSVAAFAPESRHVLYADEWGVAGYALPDCPHAGGNVAQP